MGELESFVAWRSAARVESMLRGWPGRLEDLQVAKERRDLVSRPASGAGRGAGSPVPMRFEPMECMDRVSQALRGLMVVLDLNLGRRVVFRDDIADVAVELALHARWLAESEAAEPYLDELFDLERHAVRLVDLPPDDDLINLGKCTTVVESGRRCGVELYARHCDEVVICPGCQDLVPVNARRAQAMSSAGKACGRPPVISRMLRSQGVDVSADRIRQWASRRRKGEEHPPLVPAGHDESGRPVYLVADVFALALEAEAKRTG